jgi:hypothetical protein
MGRFSSPDPLMFNELRLLSPQCWNMYPDALDNAGGHYFTMQASVETKKAVGGIASTQQS